LVWSRIERKGGVAILIFRLWEKDLKRYQRNLRFDKRQVKPLQVELEKIEIRAKETSDELIKINLRKEWKLIHSRLSGISALIELDLFIIAEAERILECER